MEPRLLSEIMKNKDEYDSLVEKVALEQIRLKEGGFRKGGFYFGDYSHESLVRVCGRFGDEPEAQGRDEFYKDVDRRREELVKKSL